MCSSCKAWNRCACILGLISTLVAAAPPARAQDIEYDQTHTPREILKWWSAGLLAPVGQEFVPQVTRLDVVELLVWNQDSSAPLPASCFVRIHRDSIAGTVIATSHTVEVLYMNNTPIRFDFAPSIETRIDSMYAIELVVAAGEGNPMITAGPDVDLYPPGRGVVAGTRLHLADMWFRTGMRRVASKPSTWSEVKLLYR